MPFLLWHFSPGDKIENSAAQFLAVCWIVRVEFKVQRPRDGLSVSNALLLDQVTGDSCLSLRAMCRFVLLQLSGYRSDDKDRQACSSVHYGPVRTPAYCG